jgi:hypothetical protein
MDGWAKETINLLKLLQRPVSEETLCDAVTWADKRVRLLHKSKRAAGGKEDFELEIRAAAKEVLEKNGFPCDEASVGHVAAMIKERMKDPIFR